MKFKPTHKAGGVVVELGPRETQLPPLASRQTETACPVFRLRKILVPVDFSDCSKKALEYAVPFAKQFDAELTLLHVVEPYPPVPQMDTVDAESIQVAQAELEAVRGTINSAVPATALLRTGDPHAEIISAAKEHDIDLIILSTHGRTRLAHVFLGGTVEKVARRAGCPILIVRENEHDFIGDDAAEDAVPIQAA